MNSCMTTGTFGVEYYNYNSIIFKPSIKIINPKNEIKISARFRAEWKRSRAKPNILQLGLTINGVMCKKTNLLLSNELFHLRWM